MTVLLAFITHERCGLGIVPGKHKVMKRNILAGLLVCLLQWPAWSAGTVLPNYAVPGLTQVYAASLGIYSGGAPTEQTLVKLKAMGVRHIVDLRPSDPPDTTPESAIAKRLGLSYQRLPVGGVEDISVDKVEALNRIIAEANAGSMYVHCRTGKRAASMLTLRDIWIKHHDPQQAIEHGRRIGLGDMEEGVQKLLKIQDEKALDQRFLDSVSPPPPMNQLGMMQSG